MEITLEEFERLSDFIYRRSGIRFEPKKIYFVIKRVEKRMDALAMDNFTEYLRYLRFSDRDGKEFQNLIDLLTVNETYFFRDFPQLQTFAEHCLADVVNRKFSCKDMTLRIWSAGCSTGEEPYTLSIILYEMLDDIREWEIEILASDIDRPALERAKRGIYDRRSVKDVPSEYLDRYFLNHSNGTFAITDKVKSIVKFEHLNLSDRRALRKWRGFDFIFCRNVLIYFDDISRKQVVDHFYIALNRGGYIFLGSSESIARITTAFRMKRANNYIVYCKE